MNYSYSSQLSRISGINTKNYLLLFIVWPFLALVTALSNYSRKESKNVVYLFLIYYGFTFVVGNAGNDAERYLYGFKTYAELPFSDFFKIVGGIYSSDSSVDIIEPLISFIISRFASHHSFLFAAYAALFGFFYLKSINLLHERYQENPGYNALIHFVFFIMILPISAINGFRMWTAAWIFFFGAYHVVLNRDPKYLLITLGASLVHFSYLSVNAILIIYYLAGNRNVIYLPLAVLSFIVPQLVTPYIQSISGILSGGLRSRVEMYSSETSILGRQENAEQLIWFMKISSDLVLYYLILAILIIQVKKRSIIQNVSEKNLFSFLLLFLTFVNFGMQIPSFGGRFQTIFFMFATLYVFLYYIKLPGSKINLLTLVGLFPLLLYAAISFRQASDSFSVWILTPGLGLPFLFPDLSIADFLF